MLQHILVPLDGSARAEAILPHAAALARATGRPLRLLQVVAIERAHALLTDLAVVHAPTHDSLESALVSLATQTLEHEAALLRRAGVEVSCEVVVAEEAAPAILARADAPDIAIVAIATHGAGDAWHMPIGATSSHVVRDSSRPMLVLPNAKPSRGTAAELQYRRVVALVDHHDVAEHDLTPLWALAGMIDGTVVLAAVRPAHAHGADGELEGVLRDGAARLRDHGANVRTRLIEGTVDELARRICEEEQADLLALTLHGGRERHWFGDIAGRVLRRSCLPALLVPVSEIEHAAIVGGSTTHQRAAPFIR